ncbi:class I SAM-dependent methyltransferase [Terrihabitans sp. B22-R8]|uniref:class I SAM-dependent methyltransferase n=1 Tax=Terrihabitans sp. B22-R8 TaxID=3425128 RepID=UPI00403CCEC7
MAFDKAGSCVVSDERPPHLRLDTQQCEDKQDRKRPPFLSLITSSKSRRAHLMAERSILERVSREAMRGYRRLIHGRPVKNPPVSEKPEPEEVLIDPPELEAVPPPGVLRFDYDYEPSVRKWSGTPADDKLIAVLDAGRADQISLLHGFQRFKPDLQRIPFDGDPASTEPFWANSWFESFDALSLYCFLAANNPETYVEVGSGNSTKFARRAISDHGLRTKIISIDPSPRAEIDAICDEVIRMRCEDVDQSIFRRLKPSENDILLIDNSHRSFQGSDVTVFFTEILPALNPGLLFCIHDIFLPSDYPEHWKERFYNEQYLLMMFLLGGADGGKVVLPVAHLETAGVLESECSSLRDCVPERAAFGGAFWMRR